MAPSRREFIFRGVAVSGAAAVAGAGLTGCIEWTDPAHIVDVPAAVNGLVTLNPSTYPELFQLGSALAIRIAGVVDPVLVVHWDDDSYTAMRATCTHANCPLGFAKGKVACPCHGSLFDHDGTVLKLPAPGPLKTYPTTIELGTGYVVIDLLAGTPGFPTVVDGGAQFLFSQFPQLLTTGGYVEGTPRGYPDPILIIAGSGGTYTALNTKCSHLGCTVQYFAGQGLLACPCHESNFSPAGVVLKPPATKSLTQLVATADVNGVTVTLG